MWQFVLRSSGLLCAGLLACAAAQAVERVELEAAIVYNILLFVEWPAEAAPAPGGALVLCVDPASALGAPLKSLEGRRVRGWRLELREPAGDAARAGCHALFLDSKPALPSARREALRGQPVLVIADEPQQPADGVAAVRLAEHEGRLGFEVDLGAARQSKLQISSHLLRLARRVLQ